jgi:hypothetical protein
VRILVAALSPNMLRLAGEVADGVLLWLCRDLLPYLGLPFYREAGVRDGLARYRDAGTTTPALGPIAKTDFEATLRAGAPGAG